MKFLEKDLEEIIFNYLQSNESYDKLRDRGLDFDGFNKSFRQLNIGAYGVSDLVTYKKPVYDVVDGIVHIHETHKVNIIELKKDKISLSTFIQGVKYCKGVKRYFNSKGLDVDIELTLIGKTISCNGEFIFLTDLINGGGFDLNFYTYCYDIDGIKFHKQSDYYLINDNF